MKHLDEHQFLDMVKGGTVVTINGGGISVVKTIEGNFVKIFRPGKILSSDLLTPRPHRFMQAVEYLTEQGIPTVRNAQLYWVPKMKRHLVHYQPLEGKELREVFQQEEQIESLFRKWIELVVRLHDLGFYFRGINFSNVLLCPDGNLGLIDVAGARILTKSLSLSMRARNLKHPLSYAQDKHVFGKFGSNQLISQYCNLAQLSAIQTKQFADLAKKQHPFFSE